MALKDLFEKDVQELEGEGFLFESLQNLVKWGRSNSMWPVTFGLACCAIEMMAATNSRNDMARFGSEVFRASPRQADVMIVAGRLSRKMAPVMRRVYDQMPDPKWVIAMGACASSGGMFNNYAIVQNVDSVVPVDIFVPGCPPRPEAVIDGLMLLMENIQRGGRRGEGIVVPTAQVPKLAQLKKKDSAVNLAVEENKRLQAERAETLSDHLHDDDEARIPALRNKH